MFNRLNYFKKTLQPPFKLLQVGQFMYLRWIKVLTQPGTVLLANTRGQFHRAA